MFTPEAKTQTTRPWAGRALPFVILHNAHQAERSRAGDSKLGATPKGKRVSELCSYIKIYEERFLLPAPGCRARNLQVGFNASLLDEDLGPSLAEDFQYRRAISEPRLQFLQCELTGKAIGEFELGECV